MKEIIPPATDEGQAREIVVYGGSFNPPTLAHAVSVAAIRNKMPRTPILVMPSAARLDKPELNNDMHRIAMLELMGIDNDWDEQIRVTDFEMRLPAPSQTHKTVKALQATGAEKIHFVSGVDSINSIHSWEEAQFLLDGLSWLIVNRDGCKLEVAPTAFDYIEIPPQDGLSSTVVRDAVRSGRAIYDMVSPSVALYIEEHNLYKE